jgi:Ca2+-binding RTX toxin-like protein
LTKGAELIVTKDMFALSANGANPSATSITISALANGEFRKGGLAISQFMLKDVQDGLVTFVHDNSINAPSFKVAVSDGTTSSLAKAARIVFAPNSLVGLDNVLTGTSGDNILIGGDGNDTIRGGQGMDVLYGHGSGVTQGLDNDIFVWGSGDAGSNASDIIRDFTAWNGTSGDKLDLSALLVGYQAGTSDLSQWISVQNDVVVPDDLVLPVTMGSIAGKTGALLTIDIDGAGSGTVKQLIFLENVSLTTINPNQLVSSGVILLDNTPPQSGLNPNHLISGGVILA